MFLLPNKQITSDKNFSKIENRDLFYKKRTIPNQSKPVLKVL